MEAQLLQRILTALEGLRVPFLTDEYDLHRAISQALEAGGITYQREARLAAYCRPDFFIDGIVIEAKRSKTVRPALLRQLGRYAALPCVAAVILVTERSVTLPAKIAEKPVYIVALNRLWGVAL